MDMWNFSKMIQNNRVRLKTFLFYFLIIFTLTFLKKFHYFTVLVSEWNYVYIKYKTQQRSERFRVTFNLDAIL